METDTQVTQEVAAPTQVVTPEPVAPATPATPEPDWRDAEIKKLRTEAANHRTAKNTVQQELDAFKAAQADAIKAAERAKLEETERLKLEKADVEKAAQERQSVLEKQVADHKLELRNTKAELAAKGLNFIDTSDAIKLLDWSQVSEDLSNLTDVMTDLVRAKPHLLGVTRTSATNTQTRSEEFSAGMRIPASKLTDPAFCAKYEKEIQAAFASHNIDHDR